MSANLVWGFYALLALRPLSLVAYTVWALRSSDDHATARGGSEPAHA